MILLRHDCLVFEKEGGEHIPAAADEFAVELIGEAVGKLDEDMVKNAAEAVLHYFKVELGRTSVTVGEFSNALERTLRDLGYNVKSGVAEKIEPPVLETDLNHLAESGQGIELMFFSSLREKLRQDIQQSPKLLRVIGLRACVKRLLGATRWNGRCQAMSDQIVDYLRSCVSAEMGQRTCALAVL